MREYATCALREDPLPVDPEFWRFGVLLMLGKNITRINIWVRLETKMFVLMRLGENS